MNIFKRLFSSSKTSRDIFDKDNGHLSKFGSWVGNMTFTTEEFEELDEEVAKGIRQFAVDTLTENTDRSRTRRRLAIFTIQFYALLLFLSGILFPFNKEWSNYLLGLATETEIGWLVIGVGAFFWGTHALRLRPSKGD